jgi:predicted nucleotidyltransferase
MRQPHLTEILQELKRGLVEIYGDRLANVILYGSQARGDAEPDSDIDVLIVLKGEVQPEIERERTIQLVGDVSLKYEVLVSCQFVSLSNYLSQKYSFFINVHREGIAV